MKQDLMELRSKRKSKISFYEIEVVCTNCDHETTIRIPKGKEWHDKGSCWLKDSHYGEQEFVYCNNCGCGTLIKKEKKGGR